MSNTRQALPIDLGEVVTTSAAKQIAESIRNAILEGRLKIDTRLPSEEELAVQFNVSRPTVREALKRLAAQYLIRSRRGPTGGSFVTSPAPTEAYQALTNTTRLMVAVGDINFEDMMRARLELETTCLRLACENRTEDHLKQMEVEIASQAHAGTSDESFCDSDVKFHRLIANSSGNAVMKFLMHSVIEALQPVSNMIIFRVRERKEIVHFHRRIHAAILARRPAVATRALADLINYTKASYQETFVTQR